MCSIIGYCGPVPDRTVFDEGFSHTKSRGPDDTRVLPAGPGLLGFHRLAIMGLSPEGMQPFEREGSCCVCNGEIYGFERLRKILEGKGYAFRSGSDCEILLPMYQEYGTDMFALLDAEFACILYDGQAGEFIAARDPIGIRPLYYGYDGQGTILFASEPKNLLGLTDGIMPFPPGHYYKEGKFVCYRDIAKVDRVCHDGLEEVCRNIREKLIALFGKELYTANGLDKKRLASHIFGNPEQLGQVNAIIHPEVNRHFLAWAERQDTAVCAIESAILFESGFNRVVDTTLMVYAPMEIRISRVLERDAVSREEVIRRIKSQLPDEIKKEKADHVIINDGQQALLPQIRAFLTGLRK